MLKTPEINASELYAPKLCIKLGIIFILSVLNIITPKLFFVNRYFIVEHVLCHCIFQC
jgi:hypothetical protein